MRITKWALSALVSMLAALGVVAPAASALSWSGPTAVARLAPYIDYGSLTSVSCPSTRLCVAVDSFGNVVTSTSPSTAAWTTAKVLSGQLTIVPDRTSTRAFLALACPSADECIAVDNHGDLVTSQDPTGGTAAWRVRRPAAFRGTHAGFLSCPSIKFCAAALDSGRIAISTNPLGGSRTWSRLRLTRGEFHPAAISCPSRRLCIVSGWSASGTTTATYAIAPNPAGSAVRVRRLQSPRSGVAKLSCPSLGLCVGLDGNGGVVFVKRPGAIGARWRTTSAHFAADYAVTADSIECQSVRLCVAGVFTPRDQLEIVTSTRPTGGAAAWRPVKLATPPAALASSLASMSCPSRALCVAVDNHGEAFSSTSPSARSRAWTVAGIDGGNPLRAVSCGSPSVCVAVADDVTEPLLAATTAPTGPADAWAVSRALGGNAIACPAANLCVATNQVGGVLTSSDPTGPVSSWSNGIVLPASFLVCPAGPISCPSTFTTNHLACASVSLCVGFGVDSSSEGGPYSSSSSNPAAGAGKWTTDAAPSFAASALACPSSTLCVAVGRGASGGGYVATTNTPTDGGSWRAAAVDAPGSTMTGVACPSVGSCLAVDDKGNLLSSTDPTNPSSWSRTSIDPGHALDGVACASTSLCVAFDDRGTAFQSPTPLVAASWSAANLEAGLDVYGKPIALVAGSCPSNALCVLSDSVGNTFSGTG